MKNKNQRLVYESLDEFVASNINESVFDTIKSKLHDIKTSITKIGKFYVAKFKDFVLDVGLPVNIGLLLKSKKLGKYDYYIPSANDLELEPSFRQFTDDDLYSMRLKKQKEEYDAIHKKFKSAEDFFRYAKTHTVSESSKFKFSNKSKLLEHIDDMKSLKSAGISDVNMAQLRQQINVKLRNPTSPNPLMIWGAPGIGKTATINNVLDSRKQDGCLIYVDIQYTTPESWFMPYLQEDETVEGGRKYVDLPKNKLPLYLPAARNNPNKAELDKAANDKANAGNGGIIFFDEIMRGSEQVLGTCLSLMAGRKIEDYVLGDKWVVMCASNRKEDMTNEEVLKYDRVLNNRFLHVNYVPLYSEWKQWARQAGVNNDIIKYLDHNYEKFFYDAGRGPNDDQVAYATPRSWTDLSSALAENKAYCDEIGVPFDKLTKSIVISGCVGAPIAEQLIAFMTITEKYPLDEISKIWTDPARGPKLEKGGKSGDAIKLTEVTAITIIAVEMMAKKNSGEMDPKEFTNFCKWIISLDHAAAAGYAVRMLVEEYCPYMHPELGDHKKDDKGNFIGKYKEGGDLLRKKYGVLWGAKAETA